MHPGDFLGIALRHHDLQLVVHIDHVAVHHAGRLELTEMAEIHGGIDVRSSAIFLVLIDPTAGLDSLQQ